MLRTMLLALVAIGMLAGIRSLDGTNLSPSVEDSPQQSASSNLDSRLRSAYLLRSHRDKIDDQAAPARTPQERVKQLQQHFDAVWRCSLPTKRNH